MNPTTTQSASTPFAATDHRFRASSHQLLHPWLQVVRRSVGTLSGFAILKVGHPNSNRYSAWRLRHNYAGLLGLNPLVHQLTNRHHSWTLKPLILLCSSCFERSFQ